MGGAEHVPDIAASATVRVYADVANAGNRIASPAGLDLLLVYAQLRDKSAVGIANDPAMRIGLTEITAFAENPVLGFLEAC